MMYACCMCAVKSWWLFATKAATVSVQAGRDWGKEGGSQVQGKRGGWAKHSSRLGPGRRGYAHR
eukprot:1139355-Pelagomonas_calceolata.AAC.4